MEEKKKKKYNPYWKKNKNKHKNNNNKDTKNNNETAELSAEDMDLDVSEGETREEIVEKNASESEPNEEKVKKDTHEKSITSKNNKKQDKKQDKKHDKKNDKKHEKSGEKRFENKKPKPKNTVAELYEEYHISEDETSAVEIIPSITEEYDPTKMVTVVGVRYKDGGKTYYFDPVGLELSLDEEVIVDTSRGIEFGFISVPNKEVRSTELVADLKTVIRKATDEDREKYEKNKQLEEKAKKIWPSRIASFGLVMQLVDVEYTFDNTKLIFYYTADGRVDFRELVKDLAGLFHTRIELRQIGVRDEAKLLGGLGICGRPFCCKEFLKEFAQVSIKMAKEQNLSLTSSKISGNCGRLMCCLSFEQKVYEMEYATFPKVDSLVETPQGRGVICESNFLTGKIKVKLMDADRAQPAKTFTADQIKVVGMVRLKETEEELHEE